MTHPTNTADVDAEAEEARTAMTSTQTTAQQSLVSGGGKWWVPKPNGGRQSRMLGGGGEWWGAHVVDAEAEWRAEASGGCQSRLRQVVAEVNGGWGSHIVGAEAEGVGERGKASGGGC